MIRNDSDLVRFCLRHMTSKAHIHILYDKANINYKLSDSYEKLVLRLEEANIELIHLAIIKNYHRDVWQPAPKELHIANLKTGLIKGFNTALAKNLSSSGFAQNIWGVRTSRIFKGSNPGLVALSSIKSNRSFVICIFFSCIFYSRRII